MKRWGHLAAVVACVWSALAGAAQAGSRLIGDDYTLSYTNFPGDIGATEDPEQDRPRTPMDSGTLPGIVTFDGVEEVVGGMRVNERVVEWPGEPGGIPVYQAFGVDGQHEFDAIDWENKGEVVEFAWDTVDGSYISADATGQSFITVRDLNWKNSDPGAEPYFFENGWYMYFTKDGKGLTGYATIMDIGLAVGPHPFDKSVEEVFYIFYSRGQVDDIALPYEGGVDLTFGTTQLDEAVGSWDLLAQVMSVDDQLDGVNGLRIGFLVEPPAGQDVSLPGDFNNDGVLNDLDINDLTAKSASVTNPPEYDLNNDQLVNADDVKIWVKDLYGGWIGDANLNREFNSTDLIDVLAAGTYEANVDAVWTTGDFNGDGRTNSGDLIEALADGGYELGPPPPAVAAVPEPASVVLVLLGVLLYAVGRRS